MAIVAAADRCDQVFTAFGGWPGGWRGDRAGDRRLRGENRAIADGDEQASCPLRRSRWTGALNLAGMSAHQIILNC